VFRRKKKRKEKKERKKETSVRPWKCDGYRRDDLAETL
jgi:hypothetical protein